MRLIEACITGGITRVLRGQELYPHSTSRGIAIKSISNKTTRPEAGERYLEAAAGNRGNGEAVKAPLHDRRGDQINITGAW